MSKKEKEHRSDEPRPDELSPSYKYDEGRYLEELWNYIDSTYTGHYVGENNVQALDLLFATDHGEGFCIGSALKYLSRYGKKEGKNRKDLLKAAHYVVLALYLLDRERKYKDEK